jgi:hypothetical protein
MDRKRNPYTPGAGFQPSELAGRSELLREAAIDMERVLERRPTRGLMMLGLRGVGKTVLLNRMKEAAERAGLEATKIEAPENGALARLLAPELRRILYNLDLKAAAGEKVRRAVGVLRNFVGTFNIKIGDVEVGVKTVPGTADSGDLAQDLPALLIAVAEAAAEKNSAVCIFIDEVQYLSRPELTAVVVACHEAAQRNLPLLFIGAGLPQIAALAGNAKSYAERLFNYPEIGQLAPNDAKDALVKPAKDAGVEIDADAVAEILRVTERYPYFIQEWGAHLWNATPSSPIRKSLVLKVTPAVVAHLDASFFRVRFDRITTQQQRYLRAMAELGAGPHKTGAIAAVLGAKASDVAYIRQQLIEKGMVWSPRYGETAFTVPMFDEFMKRRMPGLKSGRSGSALPRASKKKGKTRKGS